MEFEKFPNPPIKEAIFTITFKNTVSIDVLREFSDLRPISDTFKIKKNSSVIQQQIKTRTEKGHSADLHIKNLQDGYILQNADNPDKVIQAKTEALSFHKIQGYSEWDALIKEYEFIVNELIKSSIEPIEIKEVSVRYINHIPYNPHEELREYFNLLPSEVEGIPPTLNSFFLQMGITEEEKNAIITETIYSSKDILAFIIDLKVSKALFTTLDSSSIWEVYQDIRLFKNRLFFSIITDKTKRLFR